MRAIEDALARMLAVQLARATESAEVVATWAEQGLPKQQPPFGLLRWLDNDTRLGYDDHTLQEPDDYVDGEDIEIEHSGPREGVCKLEAYGPREAAGVTSTPHDAAYIALQRLSRSLEHTATLAALRRVGLVVVDVGSVVNLPLQIGGPRWEPRATLDMRVRYTASTIESGVGYIETFEATSVALGWDDELIGG